MDTVSFAYHTVLAVGLRMDMAASRQLETPMTGSVSSPVTAGMQGRKARRVLSNILLIGMNRCKGLGVGK
jgi:hypothetical protein